MVNRMKTSGMMQMKIIRPFKWDWNCKEYRRLDQTSVQGFRRPVGSQAALHFITVCWKSSEGLFSPASLLWKCSHGCEALSIHSHHAYLELIIKWGTLHLLPRNTKRDAVTFLLEGL